MTSVRLVNMHGYTRGKTDEGAAEIFEPKQAKRNRKTLVGSIQT